MFFRIRCRKPIMVTIQRSKVKTISSYLASLLPCTVRFAPQVTLCTYEHEPLWLQGLCGAAGRIRTADLILTKKPWMLLRCTHSYRGKTSNPLCCKGLEVLLVLICFNMHQGVLRRFGAFVGKIVGKQLASDSFCANSVFCANLRKTRCSFRIRKKRSFPPWFSNMTFAMMI